MGFLAHDRMETMFALGSAGAHQRDSETIFSHLISSATDEELLKNAVSMNVSINDVDGKN